MTSETIETDFESLLKDEVLMNTLTNVFSNITKAPDYSSGAYSSYKARLDSLHEARRKMSEDRQQQLKNELDTKKTFTGQSAESLFNKNYADALRAQRNKSKNTSLNKKKIKYRFKSISSKIISSKTSASAKQVVSMAKREVMRLKKEKQKGGYDAEEIEAAIAHAKAMEIVAKKKARHLEQEEMAKAANGIFENNPALTKANEERDEEQTVENTDETALDEIEEEAIEYEEFSEEYTEDEMLSAEDIQIEMLTPLIQEMSEELAELESDLMEEMGLDELTEEFLNVSDMDASDLKELKMKHRLKEQKEIAEADAAYLKAVFEQMAKEKASGSVSFSPGVSGSPEAGVAVQGAVAVSSAPAAISLAGASAEAPSFDAFA
jgi:hypothetical protein